MEPDDYLQIIRREGNALLEAGERAPHASVPWCPGWDMADIVWHITEVHLFWGTIVETRASQYEDHAHERPDPGALIPAAKHALDFVVRVLSEPDPDTEVWTWAAQHDVAFVIRRMAHETAVHRWDAERAAGIDATIDPELASDGIDEYLSFFLMARDVEPGSVHLHSTDAPGEWLVRFGTDRPKLTREHAKGDAAVRGPAADILLALWERVPFERLEIIGNRGAVDRLWSLGQRA